MKRFIILIIILAVVVVGVYIWEQHGIAPVDTSDKTQRVFVIQKGEGIRQIANNLKAAGLIRNPLLFLLVIKESGLDGKIQAGEFHISPAMSALEIANALRVGTFDVQITIPEGKRAEEIAEILKEQLLGYEDTWRAQLNANEGYLFPDTYSFSKSVTIDDIIKTMRENFQNKYNNIPDGVKTSLTLQDIVTVASLVAREARFSEDRPLVASVIFNRLHQGMALQLDSTIQYALGYQPNEKTWWKKDLTEEDLQLESTYNTYIHTGLPPTPISNPGIADLTAVISAPTTAFLYYISDKQGHNHFAKTLAEHNANIQRYGL